MDSLVIFSGGQDSTTCLVWAVHRSRKVEALSFVYGQRHIIEIEKSRQICDKLLVPQKVVNLSEVFKTVTEGVLMKKDGDVNATHPRHHDLPASFIPNRNGIFITLAHAYAQKNGFDTIVGGMSMTDYSGYPDCRDEFIRALIATLNIGAACDIHMETPLMHLSKAETFKLAKDEGCLETVLYDTNTCYNGMDNEKYKKHAWGWGCGECPACRLREKGWEEYIKKYC